MRILKDLLFYLKHYKKESFFAPLFKLLEATFELIVPLVMAAIIDTGVATGDKSYIMKMCMVLVLLAVIGLAAGVIYYMTRDKQPEESSRDSNALVIDLITTTTHTQPVMTTIASATTTETTTVTTITTQPEEVTTEAATTTAPTITTDAPTQNTKPAKTTAPGTKPDTGVTALRPANPLPLSSVTGDWTMCPDDLGLEESMQAILTIGTNGKLTLNISTNGQEMMSDSLPYSYDPDTHLLQAVQDGETAYLFLELTNSNTLRLYSYDLSTGINLTDFVIMVRQ